MASGVDLVQVATRIDRSVLVELERIARTNGRSVASELRLAIGCWLALSTAKEKEA